MTTGKVFVHKRPPSTKVLREAIATGLLAAQGIKSDQEAADLLGISAGTVSNIRQKKNSPILETVSTAAFYTDCAFIAPWLAELGFRPVPLNSTCTTDAGVQTELARLGLKIAIALDPLSPGGIAMTPGEARDMMDDLDRFQRHMDRIRAMATVAA